MGAGEHTAQCLVVVDMQRAFVEGERAVPAVASLVPAVQQQLTNARAAGALVVHLQNDGGEGTPDAAGSRGWELALEPLPDEIVVRKSEDDGFRGTHLARLLRERGVAALSICGVASEMCVAATAHGALDRGYRVLLAHDSHATYPVPPLVPGEPEVPASHAARVAEWSLGSEVSIVPRSSQVGFTAPSTPQP